MPFKNNHFVDEPDADHAIRIRQMAGGLVIYGDELGFTEDEIEAYDTYANAFDVALDTQQEEFADVDEVYVELKAAYKDALVKYRACQALVRAEIQFAELGTVEYLMERFHIDDDLPKTNKGFIKLLEYMGTAHAALAVEHPDVTLPDGPFDALETAVGLYDTLLAATSKELAEQMQATALKNALRKTQGEKLLRKCYLRVLAYWGNNDPRMFELGLVPKSSIWTPGMPEPGEPELPENWDDAPTDFTVTKAAVGDSIDIKCGVHPDADGINVYHSEGEYGDDTVAVRLGSPEWAGAPMPLQVDVAYNKRHWLWVCAVKDGVEGDFAGPLWIEFTEPGPIPIVPV